MSAFTLFRNRRAFSRAIYPYTRLLSVAGAERACRDIRQLEGFAPTPLRDLQGAASRSGVSRVYYKDESSRFGLGSFKALGGAYAVGRVLQQELAQQLNRTISLSELSSGAHENFSQVLTVACASEGNHGRSIAAGAQRFHCQCCIFLHEGVSAGREQAIRDLGAAVMRVPGNYDDSVRAAALTARREGWQVVADTTEDRCDPVPAIVLQGYATLVIETLEQLGARGDPLPTHVFLQGGVGGLAAAVVAYFWEHLRESAPVFCVVEPRRADCLYQSAVNGQPTPASGDLDTLMAGLACGEVSHLAWPILDAGVEFFMTIDDAAAVESMRLLYQGALAPGSIIAGESGAAGLAGLLAAAHEGPPSARGELRLDATSRVMLIGTEGATDPQIYKSLVSQGENDGEA